MKINIFPLLAAGITLLSGCNRGSDISESVPESTAGEYENTRFSGSESAEESVLSDSPAGISAAEYAPEPIPETDINGNVSLVKNQFDYLREMTDFSGQYMTFEEMGFRSYTLVDLTEKYGRVLSADGERIFFQDIEYDNEGYPVSDNIITEYNVRTGTAESFTSPMTTVLFIDRDYIVYLSEGKLLLTIRESGESLVLPRSESYTYGGYNALRVQRLGQSIFYNISEEFSNADGSISFESSVLCRYQPRTGYAETLAADANIIGATHEDIYCASSGGIVSRYRASGLYDELEFPSNFLYAKGGQAGYILPASGETIFGQRFEVGRLLYIYQQPILMTHFGTSVYDVGITSESVAFIQLDSSYDTTVLMVDINNNMAADTGYNKILHCGSEWVYLMNYDGDNILAVNTAVNTNDFVDFAALSFDG